MASKNIDQLAAASTLSDTDKVVVAQGDAVLKRGTLAQLRTWMNVLPRLATRTPLKAVDTTLTTEALLLEAGREGLFQWRAGDFSTQIAADTSETNYVKADAVASSSGAWVRAATQLFAPNATPVSRSTAQTLWAPEKWPSVDGSLYNGVIGQNVRRSGGFGTYGLSLLKLTVSAAVPAGQFDVVKTGWLTTQNLTGGNGFGSWFGANSPSSALGQTFTGGGVIGAEFNAGNRWGDPGLSLDYGTRFYVGAQLVPDVIPAEDGETASIFPGSFAYAIGQSVHGHKWWVGGLIRPDAIMPGGWGNVFHGGTTALLAPLGALNVRGFYNRGIDLVDGTFVNSTAINLGNGQFIRFGGGSVVGGTTSIALSLPAGGGSFGHLYVNNFGTFCARWSWNGTNATIGFLGATDVARQTVSGSRGGNAALQSLLTALANFGLITDTTT